MAPDPATAAPITLTATTELVRKKKIVLMAIKHIRALFPKAPLAGDEEQDFAEMFCPPRMAPIFQGKGYKAKFSLDVLNGWNLADIPTQIHTREMMRLHKVKRTHLSPPCTSFSNLMHWNKARMCPHKMAARLQEGKDFLEFSMDIAHRQHTSRPRRYFR